MYAVEAVQNASHISVIGLGPHLNPFFIGPPSVVIAMYALFLYDSLLQLDKELRLVLKAKWTWCTFIYLFSRYYPIVIWPLYIWAWTSAHSTETCEGVLYPLYTLIIPLQALPQVVIITRAWGFTQRNPFVLAGLLIMMTVFVGLQFWAHLDDMRLSHGKYRAIWHAGCVRSYRTREGVVNLRMGCLMIGAIVVDGAATVVIVVHYITEYRKNGLRKAFSYYFLKQGLAYYTLMVTLNVVTGILWVLAKNIIASFGFVIILMVPNLLACRLILQSREFSYSSTGPLTDYELDEIVADGMKRAEDILVRVQA